MIGYVDIEIFSKEYREIDFKLAVNNFLGTEEILGSEIVVWMLDSDQATGPG